jgi:hypothetical protein
MATETLSSASAQANGAVAANGKTKLHGRAFYESIGSPKLVLAPMVEQSEFVCFVESPVGAGLLTTFFTGMAIALPVLPPSLAADEPPSLLAHVPFKNVRRKVQLPRFALPAPQIDLALAT